jgi:proteic killer suppression protein
MAHDMQSTALRKLRMLNNARVLQDLAVPPNNQLEALKGNRTGQHSIRVNRQWRICFVWTTGGPDRVEIVDYHQANPQPHPRRGSAAGVHPADAPDTDMVSRVGSGCRRDGRLMPIWVASRRISEPHDRDRPVANLTRRRYRALAITRASSQMPRHTI